MFAGCGGDGDARCSERRVDISCWGFQREVVSYRDQDERDALTRAHIWVREIHGSESAAAGVDSLYCAVFEVLARRRDGRDDVLDDARAVYGGRSRAAADVQGARRAGLDDAVAQGWRDENAANRPCPAVISGDEVDVAAVFVGPDAV